MPRLIGWLENQLATRQRTVTCPNHVFGVINKKSFVICAIEFSFQFNQTKFKRAEWTQFLQYVRSGVFFMYVRLYSVFSGESKDWAKTHQFVTNLDCSSE